MRGSHIVETGRWERNWIGVCSLVGGLFLFSCGNGSGPGAVDVPAEAADDSLDGEGRAGEVLPEAGPVDADTGASPLPDGVGDADALGGDVQDALTEAGETEASPDGSVEADTPDVAAEIETAAPEVVEPEADPAQWGLYQVGMTSYQFFDWDRKRLVPTTVWYPAVPSGQQKAKYLMLIAGDAYSNAPKDMSGAPYPVVLFSHGFRGTAVQSVTFTEYMASHGYVVVAMDHQGNTLTDFFSDDETVAKVALERPYDVKFAYEQVLQESGKAGGFLGGMADASRVAVTGHSFGGYTALMVGGAEVDVSAAQAACAAGAPSDIFCDYVGYWPKGKIVKLESPIPGLKGAVYLAPGGYSAFGESGLSKVKVPGVIFGGTLDDTCSVDVEIDPIYQGLPPPKGEVVIQDASHMSFTNVCKLPLAQQWLAEYCNVEGMLSPEKTFAVTNTLAVAYLNLHVRGQAAYAQYLTQEYVDLKFGTAVIKTE